MVRFLETKLKSESKKKLSFPKNDSLNIKDSEPSLNLPSKGIRIAHLNIRHILPKMDEITLLLSKAKRKVDVLGLSETFLKENDANALVSIKNYSLEGRDRKGKKGGGGLVVYISDNLRYERRYDLESNLIESIWIEVKPIKSKKFLINYTYRPPSAVASWRTDFNKSLEPAFTEDKEIVILGDFNFDLSLPPQKYNSWNNLIKSYNLFQLVEEPTRVTSKTSTTRKALGECRPPPSALVIHPLII